MRSPFASISSRLFFASALLLPSFLGLTGFFLDRAFYQGLYEAEESRLRAHVNLLHSVAETADANDPKSKGLRMPLTLIEPDFERQNSGLYAYIFNDEKDIIWSSNSALLKEPPSYDQLSQNNVPGKMIMDQISLYGRNYFVAHYDVLWEVAQSQSQAFRFVVIHSGKTFRSELAAYRGELWRWLGAAAVFLLIAQTLVLRFGLRPLGKLANALHAMQSGDTNKIEGSHPVELQQIIDNLNQVLAREHSLRTRYRNSLADLAHSLKTPLAVLQSQLGASQKDSQQLVHDQIQRMNEVISYQLQRAVASQQTGTVRRTRLEPLVQRLITALRKVYADKDIQIDAQLAPNSTLMGDEQDMMELVGNLLENACKYGHKQVVVSSFKDEQYLWVNIEDDGPGVPPEDYDRILKRGQRLDSKIPGQGIGLAVATDIVQGYSGKIQVSRSSLGGAKFQFAIPLSL
jgi:two-component system, OmpR family, sensor histidine kinase PhoQ